MKVVEVRTEQGLRHLQSMWDMLLNQASTNNVFLTWEWAVAWWTSYGDRGTLRLLAAFDEGGVLRGLAPLRVGMSRRFGQSMPVLSFISDGSNDSDYLDLILARGHEDRVLLAFQDYWLDHMRRGAVLSLNEIPSTSSNIPLLRRVAQAQGLVWTESAVPCSTVQLPSTWEQYLAGRRPRFRTKVRSLLRDLEDRPLVRFGCCETHDQVKQMLPILFDLHTRRWATENKPGVFAGSQKRAFYFDLASRALDRGWLRLNWVEWAGKILACQFGLVYSSSYYLLQEGYEPAAEHWNLGIGLRAWTIRESIKEGLCQYDFLGGPMRRHRSDWGAEPKTSLNVALAEPTWKSRLFCLGPGWEKTVRESLRTFVPERILAFLKPREIPNNFAPEGVTVQTSWHVEAIKRAASRFYVQSRLPALTRPLRDQYHFSADAYHHFSWTKRTRRVSRILYYHRVNDHADPFLPAISTTLFDRQMQFLARHHKVVSLPDLLDRLDDTSPEPLLAITLDDGYRDNFENAYPVLQRYGLPATIFLSTGSLDSGEPLWFEELAYALKVTSRAFLDVEIDLPRRFWMRTVNERLAANARIFSLLRGLPESGRQLWLARIRRELGVVDTALMRNRMLTWNHVRQMTGQGILFGGHTVTHPFLSKLTESEVAWEISECKRRIEVETQKPVTYFAYPNGREEDFTQRNKDLLSTFGYHAAVTTIWGVNSESTDRMELRRGGPWEQDADVFASKLDWYQLRNA